MSACGTHRADGRKTASQSLFMSATVHPFTVSSSRALSSFPMWDRIGNFGALERGVARRVQHRTSKRSCEAKPSWIPRQFTSICEGV